MDRVKKMSFGVMVVAMVGQLAYVRFGDDLEARFPAIKSARSALAGAGAGGAGLPSLAALARWRNDVGGRRRRRVALLRGDGLVA